MGDVVQMPALRVEGLAPDLSWSEVLRRSGYGSVDDLPQDVADNVDRMAAAFQVFRTEFGDPINIVSAIRSPTVNRACGGARSSRHMAGDALDMAPADRGRCPELYDIIDAMQRSGQIRRGGLCIYCNGSAESPSTFRFVHFDTRGRNSRWKVKADGRWTSYRIDKVKPPKHLR